jgi:tRNA threonylcarbamoyladenosine biosynthesis protein TsaB
MLPILAVETSGDLCSVALMPDEKVMIEYNIQQKHIHSEKLLTMIEHVLKEGKLKVDDLHHIAISTGPGSFTGLRIGFSAAKGIAFGVNKQIVPVPTFEALAFQINSYLPDKTKFIIANKVNIGEIYVTKFISGANKCEKLEEITIIKNSEFEKYAGKIKLVYGNYLNSNNFAAITSPSAGNIAKWSYIFGKDLLTSNYDLLEPSYHKQFIKKV